MSSAQHRDKLRRGLDVRLLDRARDRHDGRLLPGSPITTWDRLRQHAVAYVQIDQPACAGTTEWGTGSNAELRRFHQAIEREHARLGVPVHWHRAAKNGDSSVLRLGHPDDCRPGRLTEAELKATALAGLGLVASLDREHDRQARLGLHAVPFSGLRGPWLWELCTAMVLPFEFVGVADQFIERLAELRQGRRCDRPRGRAASRAGFPRRRRRLDETAQAWRTRYASGDVRMTRQRTSSTRAASACRAHWYRFCRYGARHIWPRRLRLHATGNDDPVPQRCATPSGKLAADSEARWMLETQLIRERNRVADTLGDCRLLVEDTLHRLH